MTTLVLCGPFLAACGDDGPDEGGDGDPGNTTPRSHAFVGSDCTDAEYPVPLGVATEVSDEIDYLDDVVACTDSSQTTVWLLNNSDAVWEIYLGHEKQAIQGDPTTFRAMFGGTAFAPGDAITFPSYERYEWHPNHQLSAIWVGYELLLEEFQSFGEKTAADALDKRTPVGAAVLTCSLAIADVAGVDGSDNAEEVLVDVFEAGASGAQCRESVGRLTYTNASGQEVTVLEDLQRLSSEAATVERVSARLSYASKFAKFIRFVVQLK